MNFFNRAITYIKRKVGKTAILLLLVFLLGTFTTGAIAVHGGIINTDANLRRSMRPIVSVQFNERATWEAGLFSWDTLTPDVISAIGQLPQVAFYDFLYAGLFFSSFDLETLGPNPFGGELTHLMHVLGTNRTNMAQFEVGSIILTAGRQFAADELVPRADYVPVIISEAFAHKNQLTLGSVFEMLSIIPVAGISPVLHSWYIEENRFDEIIFAFNVIGLFDLPDNRVIQNAPWYYDMLNAIFMPTWAISEWNHLIAEANIRAWEVSDLEIHPMLLEEFISYNTPRAHPIYVLADPLLIDEFRVVAADLLPEFYYFVDLSNEFADIAPAMETMRSIANWLLWVAVGATLLVLSLLITLFLRDRRHEIGIYLALGEKKRKIVSQILLEVVVTSLVGITLAVFAGNVISAQVSQNMLINQLQTIRTERAEAGSLIYGWDVLEWLKIPSVEMPIDDMVDAFVISLTSQTVGLIYAIGIGTVVLSIVVPAIYIISLNPKKVLM